VRRDVHTFPVRFQRVNQRGEVGVSATDDDSIVVFRAQHRFCRNLSVHIADSVRPSLAIAHCPQRPGHGSVATRTYDADVALTPIIRVGACDGLGYWNLGDAPEGGPKLVQVNLGRVS